VTADRHPDRGPLVEALRRQARELGFDRLGIAKADLPASVSEGLDSYIAAGRHGTMGWMADTQARRRHPRALWPEARSAIALAISYTPEEPPLASLHEPMAATLSVYARGRDYHDVVKPKLKRLARWLISAAGGEVKVFVDTAPLLEKPLAAQAGLGWQGKHSNLLGRDLGNWVFLGFILTSLDLPPDRPAEDHCGSCRACLDACPTGAFPAPYRLDARRCISYLTIEHKGPIPTRFRAAMGNRVYGCDDCLAVCPWNKFAAAAREAKLQAREALVAPDLGSLASLDEAGFRAHFAGTAIKRIGHARFLRNLLIALGNSRRTAAVPPVLDRLDHGDPLVRGAAVWALARLDRERFGEERRRRRPNEHDPAVLSEWKEESVP